MHLFFSLWPDEHRRLGIGHRKSCTGRWSLISPTTKRHWETMTSDATNGQAESGTYGE